MASIVQKRREALLFREISIIISEELTNANISLPTVTGVKLSNDQSHLTVYVTFERNNERSLESLNNAKGFIKTKLAKIGSLRRVPSIAFKIDDSIEKGRRIEEILKKIKDK